VISVDLISTFLPVKEFGALMTIIGIWQEKMRKFDRRARRPLWGGGDGAKTIKRF
jgi:hypothetical protein